jgi:hypothetical protein
MLHSPSRIFHSRQRVARSQHPREGQDLLDRIHKVTEKPVKWVVDTHFHGNHTSDKYGLG